MHRPGAVRAIYQQKEEKKGRTGHLPEAIDFGFGKIPI